MAKTQTSPVPSTDLVVYNSADLAVNETILSELERVLITNERIDDTTSPEDTERIANEIVAQILAAEDDRMLDLMQGGAIGWRELQDVPIELVGFRWRPSTFEDGASLFFVVLGTRLDTGDPVILTTGGRNVLAQLVNKAKRGTLTGSIVKLVEGKPTRAGFKPLWLQSVNPGQLNK